MTLGARCVFCAEIRDLKPILLNSSTLLVMNLQTVGGYRLGEKLGSGGMGVFPAVSLVAKDLIQSQGVKFVGRCAGVEERFFAIAAHRKVQHPLVLRLIKG